MNLKTWIATGALAVVVVGGSITGATVHNAQVQADAQAQQVLVAKAEATAADQLAADAAAAQAVIDAAAAQKVIDDAAAAQAAADALAAQQAADAAAAQAAADAAAAQAAAQPAPVRATVASNVDPQTGLIVCPAGSSGNTGDVQGMTSCFPDICFHITLPDSAHPECVTAFKP
jgi:hypothetical protein